MAGIEHDLAVCEECEAVHRWRPLDSDEVARCARCGAVLGRGHRLGVEALLALTLAALVTLLIANFADVASIRLGESRSETTLPAAIVATWEQGQHLVAMASAATAIAAPALLIFVRLYVLVPLSLGITPRHFAVCMRILHEVSRWNMVEVMLVAAVVSIVRMASLASAVPGPGAYAFGALALLLAGLESGGMKHLEWSKP